MNNLMVPSYRTAESKFGEVLEILFLSGTNSYNNAFMYPIS